MKHYTKEIAKRLDVFCSSNGYQHSEYFNKFLDDIMYSFGKPVDKNHILDNKTGDFLKAITSLYGEAVINTEPYTDILGEIYMELGSRYSRSGMGQFFTPGHICKLMSSLIIDKEPITNKDFIEICEPCVGAGAMLLAALSIYKEEKIFPLNKIAITCNDLDFSCCKMATSQIMANLLIHGDSLAGLTTWHGNTLDDPQAWNLYYCVESPQYTEYKNQNPQIHKKKVSANIKQLSLF